MKHLKIAYRDSDDKFCEICEYSERLNEAIKNAINNLTILKKNNNYIFKCTDESDLTWEVWVKKNGIKIHCRKGKFYIKGN